GCLDAAGARRGDAGRQSAAPQGRHGPASPLLFTPGAIELPRDALLPRPRRAHGGGHLAGGQAAEPVGARLGRTAPVPPDGGEPRAGRWLPSPARAPPPPARRALTARRPVGARAPGGPAAGAGAARAASAPPLRCATRKRSACRVGAGRR